MVNTAVYIHVWSRAVWLSKKVGLVTLTKPTGQLLWLQISVTNFTCCLFDCQLWADHTRCSLRYAHTGRATRDIAFSYRTRHLMPYMCDLNLFQMHPGCLYRSSIDLYLYLLTNVGQVGSLDFTSLLNVYTLPRHKLFVPTAVPLKRFKPANVPVGSLQQ